MGSEMCIRDSLNTIQSHIDTAKADGRLIHAITTPDGGTFVAPSLIHIDGIADLGQEIFGPVLHVATFKSDEIDAVIDAINGTGYGLTFGLHTRIDDRVQHIVDRVDCGNIYVNRNQIGAVVGSQPFGGSGLSGTGPKAGGPMYLSRFAANTNGSPNRPPIDLPGPTGESNRLSSHSRGLILCAGPKALEYAEQIKALGGEPEVMDQTPTPDTLQKRAFAALHWSGDAQTARTLELALAQRHGPIVPLLMGHITQTDVLHERHVCVDTTAAGGNAALLAEVSR